MPPADASCSAAPCANGFFATFNALVDGGWLSKLTGLDLGVLMVHMRYMDGQGVAWPSCQRIAQMLGHASPNHVQKARRKLISMRLLSDTGGWRNGIDARRLRLSVPSSPPADSATGGQSGPGPDPSPTPGEIGPTPPAESVAHPRPNPPDILSHDSTMTHPTTAEADDGDVDDGEAEDRAEEEAGQSRIQAVSAELARVGISQPMRRRVAAVPGLQPIHVPYLQAEAAAAKATNPAGWIIHRIQSGLPLPDKLHPQLVCRLLNARRIAAIGRQAISPGEEARWNDHGLHLSTGRFIPARDLSANAIRMANPQ